jgi:nitroimidazol reductase NimA-like FMN-containing flavoprotein (pyridoxamine 5'-phosphate oxidase superfamily)
MPIPREQLRLTDDELDEMLRAERTLHVATVSPDGSPHVVPLWFVWRDGAVWINNLKRSKRSRDVREGSPIALCVDTGVEYQELRGAVLYGRFEAADEDPGLEPVKAEFAEKYWGLDAIPDLKSHEWLRLRPERTVSWDFRKIPSGRDRRLDAGKSQPNA